MEAFGIWNLLKTLLANDTASENTAGANTQITPQNTAHEEGIEAPPAPTEQPTKPNACEEYFLRHERLTGKRKK